MDTIWSISYMFVIGLRLRIDSVWRTNNLAQITSQITFECWRHSVQIVPKKKKKITNESWYLMFFVFFGQWLHRIIHSKVGVKGFQSTLLHVGGVPSFRSCFKLLWWIISFMSISCKKAVKLKLHLYGNGQQYLNHDKKKCNLLCLAEYGIPFILKMYRTIMPFLLHMQ